MDLIDQDNKKEEVEEFAENIVILINGGKDKLESSTVDTGFDWDSNLAITFSVGDPEDEILVVWPWVSL